MSKLNALTLRRLRLPLIRPYRLSYRTFDEFEPYLVEVADDSGRTGFADGHISPGSSAETREGGWAYMREHIPHMLGQDVQTAKAAVLAHFEDSKVATTALACAVEVLENHPLLACDSDTTLPLLTPTLDGEGGGCHLAVLEMSQHHNWPCPASCEHVGDMLAHIASRLPASRRWTSRDIVTHSARAVRPLSSRPRPIRLEFVKRPIKAWASAAGASAQRQSIKFRHRVTHPSMIHKPGNAERHRDHPARRARRTGRTMPSWWANCSNALLVVAILYLALRKLTELVKMEEHGGRQHRHGTANQRQRDDRQLH